MKILALDQATVCTGFAIFETESSKLIKSGVIKINSKLSPTDKRNKMKYKIEDLINENDIKYTIFENTFLKVFRGKASNVTTYAKLNQFIGVLADMLYEKKIPFSIVSPASWRHTVRIVGKDRKERKAKAILRVFEVFEKRVGDDEADAICIGMHACMTKSWEHPDTDK